MKWLGHGVSKIDWMTTYDLVVDVLDPWTEAYAPHPITTVLPTSLSRSLSLSLSLSLFLSLSVSCSHPVSLSLSHSLSHSL